MTTDADTTTEATHQRAAGAIADRIDALLPAGFHLEIEWGTLWIAPGAGPDDADAIEIVATDEHGRRDPWIVCATIATAGAALAKLRDLVADHADTTGTVTLVGWAAQYGSGWDL